jgi:hypothetical protein
MTAEPVLPLDNDFEEPEEAKLRHELGVRQIHFRRLPVEDACLDRRPCPTWCHYGRSDSLHEVDPKRPYTARHSLGYGPTVAASLYPGTVDRSGELNYTEAAHFDIHAGQRGQEEPIVDLYLRAAEASRATLSTEALHLSLNDTKDLITALTYVVDVLEGRRQPIEATA